MIIPLLTQPPLGAWAAKRKPGRPGTHPRYGTTTWFRVVVVRPTGSEDLGRWSGCSGLGVELTVDEVWSGGEDDAPYFVPKAINHGRIVLERAMDHADSERVQVWLRRVAREWHDSAEGGAGLVESGATAKGGEPAKALYTGTTVIISMFTSPGGDDGERLLGSWELANAFPVAWSAPMLTDKAGRVAIEKLTLVHRGFLGKGSLGDHESARSDQTKGRFTISHGPNDRLEFQYNPREVTLEKKLDGLTHSGYHVYNSEDSWRMDNRLCFKVQALTVEGATAVRTTATKLWDWLEPEGEPKKGSATPSGGQQNAKRLTISMGPSHVDDVHLRSVEIRYTRFTRAGVPCRAVVTLAVVMAADVRAQDGAAPTGAPGGGGRSPGKNALGKGGTAGPRGRNTPAAPPPARAASTVDDPFRPGLTRGKR
ncbi:phage tail protein [Umezawaea tangerina]|uniref:Phage tail-like protein n=1 Tax=Umezawaea tangerina TaxID=84725 RepID=A0A2T0T065_9PSEU|nr:phage tail protein [Umezawaea tangerina]PRY39068.1 phage tail-like protein [Umezawaea tangerina]